MPYDWRGSETKSSIHLVSLCGGHKNLFQLRFSLLLHGLAQLLLALVLLLKMQECQKSAHPIVCVCKRKRVLFPQKDLVSCHSR
jgi:hypothetical protein